MKKNLFLLSVVTAALFAGDGENLVKQHCASCHMLEKPKYEQMGNFTAPPFDAVVFHLKDAIRGEDAQKAFVVNYVQHPSASKSVCESNMVAKYGVMPSLKGNVSEKELQTIAAYLVKAYPHPAFVSMLKEMLTNGKIKALQDSPFLINTENLPHMTKLLIQNWDKAKLGLTDTQKAKLLEIRNNTLSAVKKIKQQLAPLEAEVVDAMIDREDPKSVEKPLEEIAKLKLEASRVHLKCIADTTAVLSDEQIEAILPFWE